MIALVLAVALGAAGSASPRAVALARIAAFDRHNADAMGALYAPDAVVKASDQCKPMAGSAVAAYYADFFRRFPDVRNEVAFVIAQGDRVAVRTAAVSTAGPIPLHFPIAEFLQVEDGKIVTDEALFDAGLQCGGAKSKD